MLILVLLQFLFAGLGVFSVIPPNPYAGGAYFLQYHAFIGPILIAILSLVIVVIGFMARLPWRMTGMGGAFFGLLVLQSLLLVPYHVAQDNASMAGLRPISGLHVLNALFIFWLAVEWPFWARRDLAASGGAKAV